MKKKSRLELLTSKLGVGEMCTFFAPMILAALMPAAKNGPKTAAQKRFEKEVQNRIKMEAQKRIKMTAQKWLKKNKFLI